METLEMEALRLSSAANSTEEEEDQPVDFSQNSVGNVMRTSILSKLKKKKFEKCFEKIKKMF